VAGDLLDRCMIYVNDILSSDHGHR
jgi:hypothetical protein